MSKIRNKGLSDSYNDQELVDVKEAASESSRGSTGRVIRTYSSKLLRRGLKGVRYCRLCAEHIRKWWVA